MKNLHDILFQPKNSLILVVILSLVAGLFGGYYGAELREIMSGKTALVSNIAVVGSENGSADNTNSQIVVPESVLSDEELTMQTVEVASKSVVSIVVSADQQVTERSVQRISPFGENLPFVFEIPKVENKGTERQVIGGGTGFFVSSDGHIVTNRHVVLREDAFYKVVTSDGKEYEAIVLDRDPVNDLAVVKIEGQGFPALFFGNSDKLRTGQRVIAIGYALGQFNNSVSVGVVSGIGRDIQAFGAGQTESLSDLIQTDAAINAGNSGGPLLDIHGKVIGLNTAMASGGQNIGFAIPANDVIPVIESVQKTGKIIRPQLGVRYTMLTKEIAEANKLLVDHGAYIFGGGSIAEPAVMPGSPAEKAGLKEGDVILAINGIDLDSEKNTLVHEIMKYKVGESISLKVYRSGTENMLNVNLEEWKR